MIISATKENEMIYKGNICDGCGKVFTEDDDIVVCPDCATPQHRECYEKGDCCVNAHLHSDSYEWKSSLPQEVKEEEKQEETPAEDKDVETSPCPNCGYRNPKGTKQCKNCSMKLVVFGIDLADSIDDKKNDAKKNGDIPTYKPPFTLGQGEGFEYTENEEKKEEQPSCENAQPAAVPTPEQIGQSVVENLASASYDSYQQSFVSGVQVKLLHALIGSNAYKYVQKFRKMDSGNKISFNWAAFFFSPYWFFYRKLYKPGIIFITLQFIVSMIITPMLTPFMEFYSYILTLEPESISDAVFNELMAKMTVLLEDLTVPVMIAAALIFLMHLISGVIANSLYKKYCIKNISLGLSQSTVQGKIRVFAKQGGTSLLFVLLAYFGETLLSMLVSSLIY